MKKPKILIIGAGLSGLAFAQGLKKNGFEPVIFERDENALSRAQGYRITIRSLGESALSELLHPKRLARLPLARVADVGNGFIGANEKMEVLFQFPLGQDAAVQYLRTELRKLLLEDLDVRWNKRLIGIEEKNHQVIAHFDDGSSFVGDFLAGCDGGSSIVREFLAKNTKTPEVVDFNRVVFGGQIDRTEEWDKLLPLNKAGLVRFMGPTHSLGVCFSERADRTPTVFWALSEDLQDKKDAASLGGEKILEHCQKLMTHGWHENLKRLVDETPADAIFTPWFIRTTKYPTLSLPLLSSGRITLLGDAAHAMPPDLGMGGNNCLEDARILTSLMAGSSTIDWPTITKSYEQQMFERAKIAVSDSEKAGERFRSMGLKTN